VTIYPLNETPAACPGIDEHKTATPPEYAEERAADAQDEGLEELYCEDCGAPLESNRLGEHWCARCAAYDRHVDAQIDELKAGEEP
jgi:hypothetical protein